MASDNEVVLGGETRPETYTWSAGSARRWNGFGLAVIYLLALGGVIVLRGTSWLDLPGVVLGLGGLAYGAFLGLTPQTVTVDSAGLSVKRGWERRTVGWLDVSDIDVAAEPGVSEWPRKFPVIRLTDGSAIELRGAATRDLDTSDNSSGTLLQHLRAGLAAKGTAAPAETAE